MQTLRTVRTPAFGKTSLGLGFSPVFRWARYVTYLASTLVACGNQQSDPTADTIEAISVAPSSVATQNMLYPITLTMQSGQVSSQPLFALAVEDESGTADDWNNYLEFTPSGKLQATFTFTVPASVTPAQLSNLTLLSNYKGQQRTVQVWNFQLYDVAQSRWVTVGDNLAAKDWVWGGLALVPTAPAADFVSASRQISLRFATNTAVDNCDLDYLALSFATNGGVPAPTPPPVPPPTPPPVPVPPPTPPAGARWLPKPGTSWQIQFSGTMDYSPSVNAFDLDLFGTAKTTIAQLHAQGTKSICYLSGGTAENYRPDYASFPSSVLGAAVGGYPAERWLDVRQLAILGPIMTARMDLAVQKGCDALDVDNVDGYTNSPGFPITAAQQLAYNTMLATEAHKRGLSIGLKNDLLQIADLVNLYDFAINESCLVYSECAYMQPFIAQNKAVFALSYSGAQSSVCPQANSMNFDMLLKNSTLDAYRVACR